MTQGHGQPAASPSRVDAVWDAGDLACGDLILQLRGRMEAMLPGHVLRLVALDPGAPEDLPAWCRLTGHTLLAADHPVYYIRREER
jgi:tRNA 2-thiouridine synthesizing protein A